MISAYIKFLSFRIVAFILVVLSILTFVYTQGEVPYLQLASEWFPTNSYIQYKLANKYYKQNNLNEALKHYNMAAYAFVNGQKKKKGPIDSLQLALIYNQMGVIQFRSDNMVKSEAYFHRALSAYDKNSEILKNLGLFYFKNGRYTDSINTFFKFNSINPAEPFGFYLVGLSFQKLDRPKAAQEYFRKANEVDPRFDSESIEKTIDEHFTML